MILEVLAEYFPDWSKPKSLRPTGWNKILCPAHAERNPSASLSLEYESVRCQACGFGGGYLRVIKDQESEPGKECSWSAARTIAERIAADFGRELPSESTREPRRRVFAGPGVASPRRGKIPSRVRRFPG